MLPFGSQVIQAGHSQGEGKGGRSLSCWGSMSRSDEAPLLWGRENVTEPLLQRLQNVAWPAGSTFQTEVLASVQPEGKGSSQPLAGLGSFPGVLVPGAAFCCLQGVLFPPQQMHRVCWPAPGVLV